MSDTISNQERINKLEEFKTLLREWGRSGDRKIRSKLNQSISSIKRDVLEAGCLKTMTIAPPPIIGGIIMRNVNPFDMVFDPPYDVNLIPLIIDMIDETIGELNDPDSKTNRSVTSQPIVEVDSAIEEGYAFIAMPMDPTDKTLDDVLDNIKQVAKECGINAERIDDEETNDRITDRMLESIRKAEFVIADLTYCRPNVFYEAGYAHGLGKIPIYIARKGTQLEFDLKDYPVIFFESYSELKQALRKRLERLVQMRHAKKN